MNVNKTESQTQRAMQINDSSSSGLSRQQLQPTGIPNGIPKTRHARRALENHLTTFPNPGFSMWVHMCTHAIPEGAMVSVFCVFTHGVCSAWNSLSSSFTFQLSNRSLIASSAMSSSWELLVPCFVFLCLLEHLTSCTGVIKCFFGSSTKL